MGSKRKIISIDKEKCDGCGHCISACAEGALQLIDGKATLVKENFCDGFGDCLGECPTGALKIIEKEAAEFDYQATHAHVKETRGEDGLQQLEAANDKHSKKGPATLAQAPQASPAQQHHHGHAGGCPGSRQQSLMPSSNKPTAAPSSSGHSNAPAQVIPSELSHWPVQIHLVQPSAPFFKDKELVIMSTCGPIASPDVHWRFIRGRAVVVGCPKLDRCEGYAEKLAAIIRESKTPKVIVVRMEVPCCGGLTAIAKTAIALSGRSDVVLEEATLALNGSLLA